MLRKRVLGPNQTLVVNLDRLDSILKEFRDSLAGNVQGRRIMDVQEHSLPSFDEKVA
jgi:hypothetical protein